MKKYLKMMVLLLFISVAIYPIQQANATPIAILEIIKAGIKKVIKAVDLKIQRLQNKTIWLQNAQKTLENELSKLKLTEISEWTEKQKEQYRKYFEELQNVKSIITYYKRIREVVEQQKKLVDAYSSAWERIKSDKHFSTKELNYMSTVYAGLLESSIRNIEQITAVVTSFKLQMPDAKRIEMINNAADQVARNYQDLLRFNNQNYNLSLQRSKSQKEIDYVKKLYGLH